MTRLLWARYLLAAALLFAVPLGTARRAAPPRAHAVDVGEELKRIEAALDRVEERLLASRGSISLWDELRDRHESVSAVTCENLSTHAQAMASYVDSRREKRPARGKNRLAARAVASETASR